MSQLLLSFFSPSVPGESQEHFPDILKLLAPHPRLKENVESMATEGTSHNLPKLPQVKLNSPSSLVMLRLAVVWANMGVSPTSPSVPEKEEKKSLVVVFFARNLFLTDKTGFQARSRGFFFFFSFVCLFFFFNLYYSHFSVFGQIQLRERFDSSRKESARFPWNHSIWWRWRLYQLRGGAWEEA